MTKKVLAPLVLAACLLAGCSSDTIVARPGWQDDPIIVNVDTKDNKMKLIYDAIKGLGDTNSNILNKILFEIAEKNVGTYEELERFGNHPYEDLNKNDLQSFVNSHTVYKPVDKYKIVLEDGKKVKKECSDDELLQISQHSISEQYKELVNNVYEKLYDEIKGGSYSTDNLFYEERYVMNLRKNLYKVPSLDQIKAAGITLVSKKELIAKGRDKNESWESYVDGNILNVTPGKVIAGFDEKHPIYGDYISRKIIPDIYRTYLIQTYVREQRYSNLGRTYARKVNMITVANGGDAYKASINKMFNYFAKTYITDEAKVTEDYDFSLIEKAMRGIVGTDESSEVYKLIKAGEFTPIKTKDGSANIVYTMQDGTTTHVYKGTKLGDLVEKINKVYDFNTAAQPANRVLRKDADEAAYNEITNSGAYSFEHGLELKERDIRLTNYTKEGWYLKNGGLSDLNAKYRDNLFNIAVSNIIDSYDAYKSGDYAKYYPFGANSRKAFLTTKVTATAEEEKLIVLDDGANYMIIEIEEAVSTSKLSTSDSNTNSYRYLKANDQSIYSCNYLNDIANHVVKAAAAGDTYKSNANQYYLMVSNILFYDQSVYDYFKGQYPDLFK